MYTSLESSFSLLSYDTIIMMERSRMTEQGQFVLGMAHWQWGSYARVKNHNEPNVAAIHLFWTIGFLPVPLQIVCNRSCVIHWSCLWCHMKEENTSFSMMCTFKKKLLLSNVPENLGFLFSGTPCKNMFFRQWHVRRNHKIFKQVRI